MVLRPIEEIIKMRNNKGMVEQQPAGGSRTLQEKRVRPSGGGWFWGRRVRESQQCKHSGDWGHQKGEGESLVMS